MITGFHFLLTYMCSQKCDHCFVYSSPKSKGTFTLSQLEEMYREIDKIDSINCIYFEGGEPFLFYPLMVEGIKLASVRNLQTGVVTNAYWATSIENAELYLKPLSRLKNSCVNICQDSFHSYNDNENEFVRNALSAVEKLGIAASTICIDKPTINVGNDSKRKGEPIVEGGVKFVGRASKHYQKIYH